jgi:hypothetical protein
VFFPFLLFTRLQNSSLYKQTIVEFLSPWRYLQWVGNGYDSNLHVWLFLGIASGLLILFIITWKKRKFFELLLTLAFGYLALAAVRNIPLFTLATLPLLAKALRDISGNWSWPKLLGKKSALVFALLVVLTAARVTTNAFYISDRRLDRFGWGVDKTVLPVKAVEFLNENNLNGKILNHLNFGGWLDWRGPQPTFIDGRLEVMEDDFYREYLQSYGSGPGLAFLMARYQPQLILDDYNAAPQWVEQLSHFPEWRLIYLDGCSVLYTVQGYAPQIPAIHLPLILRNYGITSDLTGDVQLAQNTPPSKWGAWFAGFYKPQNYPMELMSLGLLALHNGDYETAESFFAEGLRRAGGGYHEIFYNLGIANLHLRRYSLGKICLEKSLALEPGNQDTQRMLGELRYY